VACRALLGILARAERDGILDELLQGCTYPLSHLRDPEARVSWQVVARIMEQAEPHLDDAAYDEIALVFTRQPEFQVLAVAGRLLLSPVDLYRWISHPRIGTGSMEVACVGANLVELEPTRLLLELTLAPGYEPSPVYWRLSRGVIAIVPCLVGLPPAEVTLTDLGATGRYDIRFQPGEGPLRRVWRTLTRPFTAGAAVRALREGNMLANRRNLELQGEIEERRRLEQERRQLARRLRRVERLEALGRLSGGIAHDFNNVLAVVEAGTQRIARRRPDDVPLQEDAQSVLRAVKRSSALIARLLAFSQRQAREPHALDLRQVVQESSTLFSRLLPREVELEIFADDEPCTVVVDQGQVEQVILNLMVNARDAMPHGGRLVLETDRVKLPEAAPSLGLAPGDYVRLSVRDNGVGIPAADVPFIFDPFFTGDPSRGTGLGLATVYGVLKQSGGEVAIQSEPGATHITLFFPAAPVAGHRR
jgi:signal transduction histidine kinase